MAKNNPTPKHPLRLINWANDGYPPIDLNNNHSAVRELIQAYVNRQKEKESLKDTVIELHESIIKLEKHKKIACDLAIEFGYKQCEKGENIQAAFLNYKKLTT